MANYFSDRVAVVTGAASGIGRALSQELAEQGARVWLTDVNEALLQKTARDIPGSEHRVLDVTDPDAFVEVIDEIWGREGAVDFLFNNAGIAVIGHYDQMSMEDFNRLIDVNLRGVFHGVQAVYSKMIARGRGHIVNTSSVSGLIPAPGFTAYSATKHAVVGLSRGLRVEAKRHGVRVSCICPGFIDTEIARNASYRGIDGKKAQKNSPIKFASAQYCAKEALAGVARNELEIVVTRHAKAMTGLQKFAPKVFRALAGQSLKRT